MCGRCVALLTYFRTAHCPLFPPPAITGEASELALPARDGSELLRVFRDPPPFNLREEAATFLRAFFQNKNGHHRRQGVLREEGL